jgi:hypothetical protein
MQIRTRVARPESSVQRPRSRIAGTRQAASSITEPVIFEWPTRRSRKVIGTSTTLKPARIVRNVDSTWTA